MKITVIENLNENQIGKLHLLYQNEWFTKGRTLDDVKLMLKNTGFIFGFCHPDTKELIGFARAISDCVYKAFVFDVIVDPSWRSEGIGKFIMNTIFDHPTLKTVSHIELYCPEKLAPYYESMGFKIRASVLLRRETNC